MAAQQLESQSCWARQLVELLGTRWEITKICDRLVAFRNGTTVGEVDFHQQPRDERLIIPLITGKKENEKSIHEKRSYRSFDTHQFVLEVDNL